MKRDELKHHLDEIAREAFPETDHPWPGLPARLRTSSNLIDKRGFKMKTQTNLPSTIRLAALMILALLVTGAMFLITDQGLAQTLLRFFNPGQSDIIPGPTVAPLMWVDQTPGVPAPTLTPRPPQGPAFDTQCGGFDRPTCTVDQIRAMVAFPVFQLAVIPPGFSFVGATGGPDQVHLVYEAINSSGMRSSVLVISQESLTGSSGRSRWSVGASAQIETVQVGSITAEYVKGSYVFTGDSQPARWQSNADTEVLRWTDQEILFTLQKLGTEPKINREALTALVGQMTAGAVAVTSPLTIQPQVDDPLADDAAGFLKEHYSLTVEQAENAAGFTIHLPARLPETLSLLGAHYDREQNRVLVFYRFYLPQQEGLSDGLLVSQAVAPDGIDCDLCGFVLGEASEMEQTAAGKLIWKEARVDNPQIGRVTGQYVEGTWKGTDCCGWVWEPDPYLKRLRWQANGIAYELTYMGLEITQKDLITIAQSIP